MRIAIHQPNFFPWLGFFHKIGLVETFVFFDHVQMMRGKGWFSRNRILLNGEPYWLTMPVEKSGKSFQRIAEVRINYRENFARKHLGTIRQAYGKCAYFEEVFALIQDLYAHRYEKLADFNRAFAQLVAARLGLTTTFRSSLELVEREGDSLSHLKGNEIVLRLCQVIGADEYISGEGCLDFIDPGEFRRHGIAFYFQNFIHPEYRQQGTASFVSHLSVLDALFNTGFAGVQALIAQQAIRPA